MKQKKKLLLGAHISIAGGVHNAIERGALINCTTIQIFTKSNRQWRAKPLNPKDVAQFKLLAKEKGIAPIVAHASYLINIGSPKVETREKSIKALAEELNRCHTLEIPYLVLHPGSRLDASVEESLSWIAKGLDSVLEPYTGKTKILLETMAGQGSSVCSTFEQLAEVRKLAKQKNKIGICVDTCHIFAAGYDFRSKPSYEALWKKFDSIIGLEHLHAIHVNDSQKAFNSHVDRHADIGKGKIGTESFRLLFNDPRFFDIAKILETPKENLDDDARNMKTIRDLLSEKTKKLLNLEK